MHPKNTVAMKKHMMKVKIAMKSMDKIMADPENPVEEKAEGKAGEAAEMAKC